MIQPKHPIDRHLLRIARDTLRMTDAGANIMGGMTKVEARNVLRKLGWGEQRIAKLEK